MSPMPREPPVTRATLPSMEKRFDIGGPRRRWRAEACSRRRRREQASTTIAPARPGVSAVASGFLSALSALARAGVDFVLVGVGGINFYARDPSEAVAPAAYVNHRARLPSAVKRRSHPG